MPNAEPNRLAATTLVRLIEAGELTAEAVVESCLARIAEREPVVRAWAHLAGEAALAKARERDRSGKKTLLNGVPFGLKDIFDSADMPTTYGSPIYVGCRPAADASAASLPRAAGGILLGKTVTICQRSPRSDDQPARPRLLTGRFLQRLGGGYRRLHGATCDRHANRRIGDPTGRLLRRRRL